MRLNRDAIVSHRMLVVCRMSQFVRAGLIVVDSGPASGTRPHSQQVDTQGEYPNTSRKNMQVVNVHTVTFDGNQRGIGLQDGDDPGRSS